MCVQNLNIAASAVPGIIAGIKIWAVPGYAHASFSQNFSWAFIWMDPLNVLAKFEMSSFSPALFHPNFGGVPVAPDRPCWGQPEQRP